ncbi:MAG: hypothetical protein A3K19_12985 [Lentisphaerae bacterium RIFOXYB12_FULL_65_16]|nr:MAG: hypothetical protein A3K18_04720 [Lentisphaerae bacterium RIFOXYA12_64_32]OGV87226.1 MAG: hypothetical protein A3K19_12985 [Lentisphaerae bacterium RIFOXYB12_FULL_65_16]
MHGRLHKVLLINPPVTLLPDKRNFNVNFPTGLAYVAAALELGGYEVAVLDAIAEGYDRQVLVGEGPEQRLQLGLSNEAISERVKACRPDVVGISAMFSFQRENYHRVAATVKTAGPNTLVIVGGAHATADPREVMSDAQVDYVVIGEGEKTSVELLDHLSSGRDTCTLDGIAYRDSQGVTWVRPPTSLLKVDDLPMPARHLFPVERYFAAGQRHGAHRGAGFRSLPILTSRGCPFHCCFCSAYQMFGRTYRARDAAAVLAEIDELVKTYNVEDIYLNDDQFLAQKARAMRILDGIIAKNYGITFDAPNGISPWMLDEEIAAKLRKAGFRDLFIAVESGNQWVLDNIIRKPVQLRDIPDKVQILKRQGFKISVALVVGSFSDTHVETLQQMQDSFDYVTGLDVDDLTVSALTPHAGSSAFEVGQRRGYIGAQYTESGYDRSQVNTPLWTSEEVNRLIVIEKALFFRRRHGLVRFAVRPFLRTCRSVLLKPRYRLLDALHRWCRIWRRKSVPSAAIGSLV